MKNTQKIALVAVLATGLLTAGAARASNLDFKLEDDTSQDIIALFLTPHADSSWGDAVQSGYTSSGNTNDISFDNDADGNDCFYDFKVEFANDATATIYSVDLCTANKIAVDVDDNGFTVFTVTYVAGNN